LHPIGRDTGREICSGHCGSDEKRDTAPDNGGLQLQTEREVKMSFFDEIEKLLGIATHILPILAAANSAAHPDASNNAVANTTRLISLVNPLVDAGEAASAAGAEPLTGAEKLANAQAAISVAVQIGAAAGVITQPEAAILPIVTAAINSAVSLNKAATPTA
jgi:hypothetical protein